MTQRVFDFSSYSTARLAFEAIGSSGWQASLNLIANRLTVGLLSEFYLRYKNIAPPLNDELGEDSIRRLLEDSRRHALLEAINILDSFLSDCLRFLFLYKPNSIPKEATNKNFSQLDYAECVERAVRSRHFQKYVNRINFLASKFSLTIDQEMLDELASLTSLRNEIAHHSGFYKFVIDHETEVLRAKAKPLPYVSEVQAGMAPVIVGNVCNSIYGAMYQGFFGAAPIVRPVNPELAELHERLRESWREERNNPPIVEEFLAPGWSMKILSDPNMPWVGDELDAWIIIPSGMAELPPSISFSWNDRHGMKAWAIVDNGPREEIERFSGVLDRMLVGQSVVVEYYNKRHDGPKFARFSLLGFSGAWAAACQQKQERGA